MIFKQSPEHYKDQIQAAFDDRNEKLVYELMNEEMKLIDEILNKELEYLDGANE